MKFKNLVLIAFIIFNINTVLSQNTYDILFPGNDRNQKCQQCFQTFNQKPKEVKFSVKREGNNLYFHINDKRWFNQLFKTAGDGLAIDVVAKDRYACDVGTVEKLQIKGLLLKPIYASKLKSGLKPNGENMYRVHVGRISDTYINKELEFNILFLNNKNLCQ